MLSVPTTLTYCEPEKTTVPPFTLGLAFGPMASNQPITWFVR